MAEEANKTIQGSDYQAPTLEEFEAAAEPLIKFLAERVHPHHTVIVTNMSAELLEGRMGVRTEAFLKD